MTSKVIAIIIVIIAISGLILGFWIFGKSKNNATQMPASMSQTKTTDVTAEKANENANGFPQATGNVDDVVNGISSQLQTEEDNFTGEESDATLGVDQKALNDLGQSYDENEF